MNVTDASPTGVSHMVLGRDPYYTKTIVNPVTNQPHKQIFQLKNSSRNYLNFAARSINSVSSVQQLWTVYQRVW